MRRLSFLLRPGWVALALVVVAFAYVCFTQLAPWQLGKNTVTEQRNALITDSFSSPATPLEQLVAPGAAPATDQEWRVVTVAGSYLAADQVLARLRTVNGTAAYEVLTPFATTGGERVLVDRGYVRPVVGTDAPPVPAPPTGPVTLQARLRLDEPADDPRGPQVVDGAAQVYEVNAATVGAVTGTTINPGYLQLSDGQPGGLGVLPLPQTDSGPYLSYGLQWLAFGIMAPLGLAYFVRAELRERKREKESPDDDGAGATPERELVAAGPRAARQHALRDALAGDGRSTAQVRSAPQPSRPTADLTDRYGKRR